MQEQKEGETCCLCRQRKKEKQTFRSAKSSRVFNLLKFLTLTRLLTLIQRKLLLSSALFNTCFNLLTFSLCFPSCTAAAAQPARTHLSVLQHRCTCCCSLLLHLLVSGFTCELCTNRQMRRLVMRRFLFLNVDAVQILRASTRLLPPQELSEWGRVSSLLCVFSSGAWEHAQTSHTWTHSTRRPPTHTQSDQADLENGLHVGNAWDETFLMFKCPVMDDLCFHNTNSSSSTSSSSAFRVSGDIWKHVSALSHLWV